MRLWLLPTKLKRTFATGLLTIAPSALLCAGNIADALKDDTLPVQVITFGGFELVDTAMRMMALIVSDNAYSDLIYTAIIAGAVLGYAINFFGGVVGGKKGSVQGSIVKNLVFVGMFVAFVQPTRTVEVYDPQQNKMNRTSGVPWIVAFTVGGMTQLESAMIDVIDVVSVSSAKDSYKMGGGGVGFSVLEKITKADVIFDNPALFDNLRTYVDECLLFELYREGSTIDGGMIQKNDDYIPIFEAAASPSITMDYFVSGAGLGNIACSDAWTKMSNLLNSAKTFESSYFSACSSAGINVATPQGKIQCKDVIDEYSDLTFGKGLTSSPGAHHTVMQSFVSKAIVDAVGEGGDAATAAVANESIMNKGLALGLITQEWLPIGRALMMSLTIALVPAMLIFIPTPKGGEMMSTLLGFFVFLTVWGIMDATIHYFMQAVSDRFFHEVYSMKLGLSAIMTAPTALGKVMALQGNCRLMGMGLSMFFTSRLIGRGAVALAGALSKLTGSFESAAVGAGDVQRNDGAASVYGKKAEGIATMQMANSPHIGLEGMYRSSYAGQMERTAAGSEKFKKLTDTLEAARFNVGKSRESALDLKAGAERISPGDPAKTAGILGLENMNLRSREKEIGRSGNRVKGYLERKASADAYDGLVKIEQTEIERQVLGSSAEREKGSMLAEGAKMKKNAQKRMGAENMDEYTDRSAAAGGYRDSVDTRVAEKEQGIYGGNAVEEKADMGAQRSRIVKAAQLQTDLPTVGAFLSRAAKTEGGETNIKLARWKSQQEAFWKSTGGGTQQELGYLEATGTIGRSLAEKMNRIGYQSELFAEGTVIDGGAAALTVDRTIGGAVPLDESNIGAMRNYLGRAIPDGNPGKREILDSIRAGNTLHFRDIKRDGDGTEGFFSVRQGIESEKKGVHEVKTGSVQTESQVDQQIVREGVVTDGQTVEKAIGERHASRLGRMFVNADGTYSESRSRQVAVERAGLIEKFLSSHRTQEEIDTFRQEKSLSSSLGLSGNLFGIIQASGGGSMAQSWMDTDQKTQKQTHNEITEALVNQQRSAYLQARDETRARSMRSVIEGKGGFSEEERGESIQRLTGQFLYEARSADGPSALKRPGPDAEPEEEGTLSRFQRINRESGGFAARRGMAP